MDAHVAPAVSIDAHNEPCEDDVTIAVKPAMIRTDEFDRMAEAGVFDAKRPRLELVRGKLYEMPPIGTAHLIVVTRLQQQLNALNAEGRLLVQQPIRIPQYNEPQPDLTVLREPLGARKPEATDCELLIEVSDSTLDFDREVKAPAYLAGGIPRVWIINVRAGSLEEWLGGPDADGEVNHVCYEANNLVPPVADKLTIDLAALFRGMLRE